MSEEDEWKLRGEAMAYVHRFMHGTRGDSATDWKVVADEVFEWKKLERQHRLLTRAIDVARKLHHRTVAISRVELRPAGSWQIPTREYETVHSVHVDALGLVRMAREGDITDRELDSIESTADQMNRQEQRDRFDRCCHR